jgi:hypothetical protein
MSRWQDFDDLEAIAEVRRLLAERLEGLREDLREGEYKGTSARVEVFSERAFAVAEAALLMLMVTQEKCSLDGKRPSDIHVRPEGPNGNLIRRCGHTPSHCWSYVGERIACPS